MGKFIEFLNETIVKINTAIAELDAEELDEFGYFLYHTFFDEDEDVTEEDEFDLEDVNDMISALDSDVYDEVLDLLSDMEEDEELDEAVSRRLTTKNMNKKKRKYMGLSKSKLRQDKAKRQRDARSSKQKRKRYYKANKMKIKSYQKSRAEAIKKGKHKVKVRKS